MEEPNNRTLAAPNGKALLRREIRLLHAGQYTIEQMDLHECPVCGRLANEAGCLDKRCSNRRYDGNETVVNNQFTLNDDRGRGIDGPGCKGEQCVPR